MILLVLALLVPRDTVLVEIYAVTTNTRVVVEALAQDGTLLLPAQALHELLGVAFPSPWISLDQLRQAYPTITARWSPEMARVDVFDDLGVLPATRQFRETTRASAFAAMALPAYSGPFGSVAVDDQRRALAEVGYLYKGRLSVQGRANDHGVGQWFVSAVPFPRLFLNASGGSGLPPQVSGRVQAGPVWISSSWTPQGPLDVAGLVRLGPVQAFSSRQFGVLTVTPPASHVTLQVARRWADGRTAARLSFGPSYAAPFSYPLTR